MVVLHAWLVLARLQAAEEKEAAQALTDALFIGFDEALREQGVSDMGMGRRMKAMANAFYGRLRYEAAARAGGTGGRRWRAMSGAAPRWTGAHRPWPPMSNARARRWHTSMN